MQQTLGDGESSERARKRCRLDAVEATYPQAEGRLFPQPWSANDRSYALTHVEGDATAVVGDVYGNMVNNHYHVQSQAPRLKRYNLLLDSLKFDRMDARLRNVKPELPDTCQWLPNHKQFRAWADPLRVQEHHGFLWIKGKPGCGKSTVMKVALDRTSKRGSMQTILSYFFNARAPEALEKSSMGLYRSLVHQILTKMPTLHGIFTRRFSYKVRGDVMDEWTANELMDFLVEIVKSPEASDMTMFVDALDEGDQDDTRQMIGFLEDLGAHALSVDNRLRICLSSRHFPHITIRKGLILIMEDQDDHGRDIKSYVEKKFHGDGSLDMHNLRREVCDKSNGIFLWVVLVVAMLNKTYDEGGSLEATRKHLESIPPELDNLFADILAKTRKDLEECVALLQFILFSNKPFSPLDLYTAIEYSCNQSQPAKASAPDVKQVSLRLLHYSRGLVEATSSGRPIMQFIHESVRDFLLAPHGLAQVLSTTSEQVRGLSHEKLKLACLRCIVCFDDPSIERSADSGIQAQSDKSTPPFLSYAISEIFQHANSAQQGQICQAQFLASLTTTFPKWIRLHNAVEIREHREENIESKDVTLLYIAAKRTLVDLVRCLLDEGADVNAVGGQYGNVLQMACVAECPELVQLLLDRGADPNTIGGEWEHALAAAVHYGNTEITKILQKHKLSVPRDVLIKMLNVSISRDCKSGVEASLNQGISIDDHGLNWKGAPLYLASDDGNEKRVRFLLDVGACVNARGGLYGNALQAACWQGHEKVVRILLNAGADVNARGGLHGNALQAACCNGHEEVVQILLDAGAHVNTEGGFYGTALQAASFNSCEKVVHLLLNAGADVSAQGTMYGNVLQAASCDAHEKVVRTFLDAGADVSSRMKSR